MHGYGVLHLVLDLLGTFAFALNGALTATRVARLDIVGVLALAMVTALGGGVLRDVLAGALPPATFSDWRYLAVAVAGGMVTFLLWRHLERYRTLIMVFDAAGLSLFAVTGATTALEYHIGAPQAVLLGVVTGVGGGTLRDVLVLRLPTVLYADLYAIPALLGAGITVACERTGVYGVPAALGAAVACFTLRMIGDHYGLNAPGPHRADGIAPSDGSSRDAAS
ncbi:trimeric intracellular cation channel family protein [Streptomyces antimycoticus]|uniref:Glycine transporter domain-containing protein n=1 Tax=Streptomyces violaceusniger TaxID=68280 RepID=A0A0X3VG09_STRVO|nr:TRIC cation channel family protein [Streptomyces antimycoticus]KUL43751.1 hypothetical protein ADL28_42205 [Streptomyces violaceusniger]QTI87990.1 TRIC cation channel family protein [Streptomyces sp. AgN23]WJE00927.1 TRIC cation channel family protein [Streptomyces antimycoticus]